MDPYQVHSNKKIPIISNSYKKVKQPNLILELKSYIIKAYYIFTF